MKKFTRLFVYLAIGLASLIFFLYLSFPYDVLKESIAVQASAETGLSVSIEKIGPRFLLGLKAQNVRIASPKGDEIELKEVNVGISLLNLLLGKIKVELEFVDKSGGLLDLSAKLGILSLVMSKGEMVLPSSIYVEAEKFNFGKFAEFSLKLLAASPSTSILLKPVLEKIGIDGKLNAKVDLSLDNSDFSRSTGSSLISLVDTTVEFDPSMQVPVQRFENAQIKFDLQSGQIAFDQSSRFKTSDIDVTIGGKIAQKGKVELSILDVSINVQLFKELKGQFGMVLDAIANKPTDGKLVIKISGLLPAPQVKIL
jgi:type II secretion system protein N